MTTWKLVYLIRVQKNALCRQKKVRTDISQQVEEVQWDAFEEAGLQVEAHPVWAACRTHSLAAPPSAVSVRHNHINHSTCQSISLTNKSKSPSLKYEGRSKFQDLISFMKLQWLLATYVISFIPVLFDIYTNFLAFLQLVKTRLTFIFWNHQCPHCICNFLWNAEIFLISAQCLA